MRAEESFTDFVVARWSMLYRLAVLLVGSQDAGELAEEALARAYSRWPTIAESPSPDDRVKEILAHAATADPGPTVLDGTGLDALTHRQRVVLSLRCFELWSDEEVAAVLRCRPDEVEAEMGAALVALGRSASVAADELARIAEGVSVPAPRTGTVLARGRERRRRRRRRLLLRTASVTAILVAGVTVAALVDGPADTPPTRQTPPGTTSLPKDLAALPHGGEPQVPYVDRSTLHLLDRAVPLRSEPLSATATATDVFLTYLDGSIDRVSTLDPTPRAVAGRATGGVVTDAHGFLVAWLAPGSGRARVVARTIDADAARAESRRIPDAPVCCNLRYELGGITASGQVVVTLPGIGAWVWDLVGGEVGEMDGIGNGNVVQVVDEDVVVKHDPSYFAVGSLHGTTFLVTEELPARQADFADPLGKRVVLARDGEIRVRPRAPSGEPDADDVQLALPRMDQGWTSIRWEDDEHVLLDVFDRSIPGGALVRCDATSGACELAVRFEGPHLLAR